MEYPFKDLMPLDEVLARDGYYKDWTHIDADVFHQISELVKFIRGKGYGSDTREAIAQALERVYHDALQSGNANMEVSMARGNFKDLASRLDAGDVRKVDKNGAGQITWGMIAQDARENISGDKVAIVGNDSVLEPHIVDKQVTERKTSYLTLKENAEEAVPLIPSVLGNKGDYYDPANGTLSNGQYTQSYKPTGKINTIGYDTFDSYGVNSWVFFGLNGFISSRQLSENDEKTTTTITIPMGTQYMIGNIRDQFFPEDDPDRSAYPIGVVSANRFLSRYNMRSLIIEDENLAPSLRQSIQNNHFNDKTIVIFGDSIQEAKNPSVSDVIAESLGANTVNGGFGGCMMTPHPNEQYAKFSMCAIADAVATGNWSIQEGATGVPASFKDTVARLKAVDWANVYSAVIAYGTNDWLDSKVLDNTSDLYDKTTYLGALRYSIRRIMQVYPNIKFLISPPIFRSTNDRTENSYNWTNGNGKKISDFVDGLIVAGKERHIPVADTFYGLGINEHNEGYYYPPTDGTHPNEKGRRLLGQKIASEIQRHY